MRVITSFEKKMAFGWEALKERARPNGHFRNLDGTIEGDPVQIIKQVLLSQGYAENSAYVEATKVVRKLIAEERLVVRRAGGHIGRSVIESFRLAYAEAAAPKPRLETQSKPRILAEDQPGAAFSSLSVEDLLDIFQAELRRRGLSAEVILTLK